MLCKFFNAFTHDIPIYCVVAYSSGSTAGLGTCITGCGLLPCIPVRVKKEPAHLINVATSRQAVNALHACLRQPMLHTGCPAGTSRPVDSGPRAARDPLCDHRPACSMAHPLQLQRAPVAFERPRSAPHRAGGVRPRVAAAQHQRMQASRAAAGHASGWCAWLIASTG